MGVALLVDQRVLGRSRWQLLKLNKPVALTNAHRLRKEEPQLENSRGYPSKG